MPILIAFTDGFAQPASSSILPFYVEAKNLSQANSLLEESFQILGIGGWSGGSILLSILTAPEILFLSICFTFLSAGVISLLKNIDDNKEKGNKKFTDNLFLGWSSLIHNDLLKTVSIMDILETLANATWTSSIILVFISEVMQSSRQWWGYVNAAFMFGTLIGSLICLKAAKMINRYSGISISLAAVFGGITTFFVAINRQVMLLLFLSAVIGIFSETKLITQTTVIQKKIAADKLANVYASLSVLYTGNFALSSVFSGILAQKIGVIYIFYLSSILLILVGLIAFYRRNFFAAEDSF